MAPYINSLYMRSWIGWGKVCFTFILFMKIIFVITDNSQDLCECECVCLSVREYELCDCMSVWVWVSVSVSVCVSVWMHLSVSVWVWVCVWVYECVIVCECVCECGWVWVSARARASLTHYHGTYYDHPVFAFSNIPACITIKQTRCLPDLNTLCVDSC